MVHALRKIHTLLSAEGVLVNIQPVGEPRLIEIWDGADRIPAGRVQHRQNFSNHKAAQRAVQDVLSQNLYRLAWAFTFPFEYHAPTYAQLERWLREEVSNAVIPEATAARARELWQQAGPQRSAVMRDEILVMRLIPHEIEPEE